MLTWWEGEYADGYGQGEYVVLDSSYAEVARFGAGNGYAGDLHEFTITPDGTALISIFNNVAADLSSFGGPAAGTLLECVVQEIHIESGAVLFEWHSAEHVGVDESYLPVAAGLWDYFHLNSIDPLDDGNLLISARHTSTIYKLDKETGESSGGSAARRGHTLAGWAPGRSSPTSTTPAVTPARSSRCSTTAPTSVSAIEPVSRARSSCSSTPTR